MTDDEIEAGIMNNAGIVILTILMLTDFYLTESILYYTSDVIFPMAAELGIYRVGFDTDILSFRAFLVTKSAVLYAIAMLAGGRIESARDVAEGPSGQP